MDQPKRQMGRMIREPMTADLQTRRLHKERKQLEEAYGRGETAVSNEMENPGRGIAKARP